MLKTQALNSTVQSQYLHLMNTSVALIVVIFRSKIERVKKNFEGSCVCNTMSTAITNQFLKVIPNRLQVLKEEKGEYATINRLKHMLTSLRYLMG